MRRNILHSSLSVALLLLLALPAAVQAQFNFTTNADNTITITAYTGPGGDVTIPDETNGYPVTTIGGYDNPSFGWVGAFQDCTSLTSVTIGTNITSIGEEAFYGTGLRSVTIPDSVTDIGPAAFAYSALSWATIGKGLRSIEPMAFVCCDITLQVFFKGNAPSVGDEAFAGDYQATAYYLPGTSNWEYWHYTWAVLPWSPSIQTANASFGVRTNHFGFNIIGAPNIPVVVEASTELASPAWSSLQFMTLTNGLVYFSDPLWTNYPTRFYRIRSP